MTRMLLLVTILLLGAAGAVTAVGSRPEAPAAAVRQGEPAPDFTLQTLEGETVSLSQYRGQVVFLNFWASWCPPCRAEMPSMERLHEVFGDRGLAMLAVNVEQDEKAVREFVRQGGHTFPVLLDPQGKAQNLYQVYRFPETFLIDKDGTVLERFIGARDWSSVGFLKEIAALVEG